MVHDNRLTGIQIGPTNTGALVKGNISDSNAVSGIRRSALGDSADRDGQGQRDCGELNAWERDRRIEATVEADGTLGNTWDPEPLRHGLPRRRHLPSVLTPGRAQLPVSAALLVPPAEGGDDGYSPVLGCHWVPVSTAVLSAA